MNNGTGRVHLEACELGWRQSLVLLGQLVEASVP
jgi:hypothetical protein